MSGHIVLKFNLLVVISTYSTCLAANVPCLVLQ
uniref:Uncharacterized protein n=1 Tax=Arundo donax TaxID=35708 RepID=A0A0A9GUG8_ARUDO